MPSTRVEILIHKLISNSLTPEELDELLMLLEDSEEDITKVLKEYFDRLVNDQ
ncbi:hypothetical protein Lbys_3380 [Leadbetterella byssophila DSM 17132]|uniref:Uncharacterized protein n=1 Tax=Leadbetterella byssophila (strain DSM 17132 / JCM 16389 / KACC 11308 / NBRC 106382 / 4M15) TaxID=649349 RepID=E4RXT4_LEAB4|nr:hypothetical protein [Leadbetterella byssophila]ADQ19031.1 hypothetical protein Lbys_3380 [Leadbetterella byssophila DSM 17132]